MRTVEEILREDRLLTVSEAARFLTMSSSWIYKRVEDGTLPAVVIGNRVRFDPDTLRAWVRSMSRGADAAVIPIGRKG